MIDADLQYPPEAIPNMYRELVDNDADVVLSERHEVDVSRLRRLVTKSYNYIFARLLFGISYDTQSGLKLFRKNILDNFDLTPSPWSFDLEFIIRSLENKLKIVSHAIRFDERSSGSTKVKIISVSFELMKASIKLRFNTSMKELRKGYRANNLSEKNSLSPTYLMAVFLFLGVVLFAADSGLALGINSSPQNLVNTTVSSLNQIVDNTGTSVNSITGLLNSSTQTTPVVVTTPSNTNPNTTVISSSTPSQNLVAADNQVADKTIVATSTPTTSTIGSNVNSSKGSEDSTSNASKHTSSSTTSNIVSSKTNGIGLKSEINNAGLTEHIYKDQNVASEYHFLKSAGIVSYAFMAAGALLIITYLFSKLKRDFSNYKLDHGSEV